MHIEERLAKIEAALGSVLVAIEQANKASSSPQVELIERIEKKMGVPFVYDPRYTQFFYNT